ncbi:MAG: 3-deoxy-8-phosphooctulonate synthase [Elusimicrobia bacterium]|nr:3-deoxy-8-phosphooctulonate synthase [Elusimicrobiota bacterium]
MQKNVAVGKITFGNDRPLVFIAGPCVIESREMFYLTAKKLKEIFTAQKKQFVLKASFDKANRTSVKSFRGVGIKEGMRIVKEVKNELKLPVLMDVHEPWQAEVIAETADILQVPAFLCRQTDLLLACARTQKPVNVKKGQFLSPWEMENIVAKIESAKNSSIMLTERGTTFGYSNLVVDMRSLQIMKQFGYPVIFDCTHSVQKPGALSGATGGDSAFAPALARAAVAVGVAGIFFETHPNPKKALSDGPNSIKLSEAEKFVSVISRFDALAKKILR